MVSGPSDTFYHTKPKNGGPPKEKRLVFSVPDEPYSKPTYPIPGSNSENLIH